MVFFLQALVLENFASVRVSVILLLQERTPSVGVFDQWLSPHVDLPDHVNGCQFPPLGTLLPGLHSACCQFPFLPTSLGPSFSPCSLPVLLSVVFLLMSILNGEVFPIVVFM